MDKQSLVMGYDENLDKWILYKAEFDSLSELAEAVAQLNLHLVKDILQ